MVGMGFWAANCEQAAAQQNNGRDVVYEAARNRVGILKYCWENGLIDPSNGFSAIQLSAKELAPLTAKASAAARQFGDEAEKDGIAGILGPNSRRSIDSFARSFRTTPAALCKEWVTEQLRGDPAKRSYAATPAPETIKPVSADIYVPMPERPSQSKPKPAANPGGMSKYGCRPEEWWLNPEAF